MSSDIINNHISSALVSKVPSACISESLESKKKCYLEVKESCNCSVSQNDCQDKM